jgi:hypothetical protein
MVGSAASNCCWTEVNDAPDRVAADMEGGLLVGGPPPRERSVDANRPVQGQRRGPTDRLLEA